MQNQSELQKILITRLDNPLGFKYLVNRAFLRCALAVHAQSFSSVVPNSCQALLAYGFIVTSNPAMDPIKETVF